tara:strand:- start:265 stop:1245 length:981 start_codon:yes stop_codon:yes gene_type:complete
MPKLISLFHPHEIEEIKSFKTFLSFSKNILRGIINNGCYKKVDGILMPVRWSKEKTCWVVDRGTSLKRDVIGIDLLNVNRFFHKDSIMYSAVVYTLNTVNKSKNFNSIAKEFGILKNEKKFVAFEFESNESLTNCKSIYFLGIYLRHNKNRDVLLKKHDTESTLIDRDLMTDKLRDIEGCIKCIEKIKLDASFDKSYTQYIDFLKSNEILQTVLDKSSFDFFDTQFTTKLNYKEVKKIINSNDHKLIVSNKNAILKVVMSVLLGKFIKEKLNLSNFEGVIFFDKFLKKHIKLTGDIILENKISFKKNLSGNKCEYNDSMFLLPKAF